MFILLTVDKVLEPFEAHEKKFYPFTTKELIDKKGKDGKSKPRIINSLVPIDKNCKQVTAELYYWGNEVKLVHFVPYNEH